jgi:Protein of unknown function (DUF2939)
MGNMRWTLRITAVLAVLLLTYAVWPIAGFFLMASTIESRDAAALAKLVDFPALRKSLTKQIIATYIEITGKEKKCSASIAMGVGTSFAEPIVARLINEEALVDLLSKGDGGGGVKVPSELAPFSESALKSGWQTWWASEYGFGD